MPAFRRISRLQASRKITTLRKLPTKISLIGGIEVTKDEGSSQMRRKTFEALPMTKL